MNWHVLRVWVVIAVAVGSFIAQRDLSRMDPVFFRLSAPGAKGFLLYFAGRYEAAAASYREHWRAAISGGATTGDPGSDLILTGDLTAAERLAHQDIGRGLASLRAKLLLAEVALERDLPSTAARLATEVLAASPDDVDAEVRETDVNLIELFRKGGNLLGKGLVNLVVQQEAFFLAHNDELLYFRVLFFDTQLADPLVKIGFLFEIRTPQACRHVVLSLLRTIVRRGHLRNRWGTIIISLRSTYGRCASSP